MQSLSHQKTHQKWLLKLVAHAVLLEHSQMVRYLVLLLLLQVALRLSLVRAQSPYDRLVKAMGGKKEFDNALKEISDYAVSLRGGVKSKYAQTPPSQGAWGFVTKLTFEDGISWAVKLSESTKLEPMLSGIAAARAVEKYCPQIPVARFHGQAQNFRNSNVAFSLMDWVDARRLECEFKPHSVYGWVTTMPKNTVTQLAEFIYNLTTCPIPSSEMVKLSSVSRPADPVSWLKMNFISRHKLLTSRKPSPGFTALDYFLFLRWISEKYSSTRNEPWVIHFFDLYPPNILIDKQGNLVGWIIDWDYVEPVPQRVSAVSLEHRLFQWDREDDRPMLTPSLATFFRQELSRIEQERSSSQSLSQLYLHSKENQLLGMAALTFSDFKKVKSHHRRTLAKALNRSQEAMDGARSEWEKFTRAFFKNQGRPVPDWPLYVGVQEALGIYGTTERHVMWRNLKRRLQDKFQTIFSQLSRQYPDWKWAAQMDCYFTAALSDQYRLPSGLYSCNS